MSTNINFPSPPMVASNTMGRLDVSNSPLSRLFDIILVLLASPYILFFTFVVSLLIVLESKGGVFYLQTRIGKGGRRFKVYKFRTMVKNADLMLQQYLDESPELKAEWLATQKLKKDPRITRVGTILRKFSLDELPQFWNVLIGDMSLVGPRPIVAEEIKKYGKCFRLYIQSRPGLTGLWQVSGRSDTSYKRRVELDEYYLLNKSLKLDIKILVKTVFVVLNRKGAY